MQLIPKAIANAERSTAIPAFDYLEGMIARREEILSAIARVIDSGQLILGPEVAAFEQEFAQFVGSKYAIATSSGTDSLIIALRSLKVGYGDEVITVANGPAPTVSAIRAVGATPRFVEIDAATMQMDPGCIKASVNSATRCVIPIHLYGAPAPIDAISKVCQDYGLELIEDCAQAHGTYVQGKHVGNVGAVGCFSFYPTKNLGAFGDAGMVVTNDAALAAQLREQACYGFRGDRISHSEGLNCRLDELQAACLRVQLNYLPAALQRRIAIARSYSERLDQSGLLLPVWPTCGTASWHQYVIRVPQRQRWIDYLRRLSISVGVHYATPVHLMPAFRRFGNGDGSLPITEQACSEVVSLPMFPELDDARISDVVSAIFVGILAGLDKHRQSA